MNGLHLDPNVSRLWDRIRQDAAQCAQSLEKAVTSFAASVRSWMTRYLHRQ